MERTNCNEALQFNSRLIAASLHAQLRLAGEAEIDIGPTTPIGDCLIAMKLLKN